MCPLHFKCDPNQKSFVYSTFKYTFLKPTKLLNFNCLIITTLNVYMWILKFFVNNIHKHYLACQKNSRISLFKNKIIYIFLLLSTVTFIMHEDQSIYKAMYHKRNDNNMLPKRPGELTN